MRLSTIVELVWVGFVSWFIHGAGDATWLPLWIFILGIAYIVLRVLEHFVVVPRVPVIVADSAVVRPVNPGA